MRSLRRDTPPDVQVARLLSVCCADSSRVPALTVAQHVEMERRRADFPDKSQALTTAMRSVVHTIGRRRGHVYRAIVDSVRCPVLLLQGDRDRLVPVGRGPGRRARPPRLDAGGAAGYRPRAPARDARRDG